MDITQISFSNVSKTTARNVNFRNGRDYSVRYMIILYKIYSTQQKQYNTNTFFSLRDKAAPVPAIKAEGGWWSTSLLGRSIPSREPTVQIGYKPQCMLIQHRSLSKRRPYIKNLLLNTVTSLVARFQFSASSLSTFKLR
jgi:hypothetical protein